MRFVFASVLIFVACRPPGYGKGESPADDDPAVDAAPADTVATTDAPSAATCEKPFRLDGHSTANSAWLTGSFTEWAGDPPHGAVEMAKGVDGAWTTTHALEAGTHQYKFIVDGSNWILDPTNPDQVDDGFGGKNSLVLCAP